MACALRDGGTHGGRGEGVNLRPTFIATADPELVVADLIDHELGWWNASRSMH